MSDQNKRKFQTVGNKDELKRRKLDFNKWDKDVLKDSENNQKEKTPQKIKMDHDIWNNSNTLEVSSKQIKIGDLITGKSTFDSADTLRIRISYKSEKRVTRNGGQLFNFVGFDGTDEIQVTCFTPEVNRFYDVIQYNEIYDMANFNVKPESIDFPSGLSSNFQIIATAHTTLTKIECESFPQKAFNFKTIAEVKSLEDNTKCDILAVVYVDWGIEEVSTGTQKRDFTCTDASRQSILMTVWGSNIDNYKLKDGETATVILRNANVSTFDNRKYINCFSSTMIWWNPETVDAISVQSWYDKEVKNNKK